MGAMLQFVLGWFYGHIFEYIAHRYLLHGRKRFKRLFRNHFKSHHNISRKNQMYDSSYKNLLSSKFEVISLSLALVLHLPVLYFAPYFFAAILWSVTAYYVIHKISHVNTAWGKRWLPWHYEHHMGKNQHINWGVRLPIVDKLFRTSNY
jgi:sterol desaturase/sphingolipid hydroxylase (fatty acid hydroxylase superfamily)